MSQGLGRRLEEQRELTGMAPVGVARLRRIGMDTECVLEVDSVRAVVRWRPCGEDGSVRILERQFVDALSGISLGVRDARYVQRIVARAADQLPHLTHFCPRQTAAALRMAAAS